MGRHLLKAPNGVIVEWSSVVDGPVAAFKDEDAARTITVVAAGVEARTDAHREWERRVRRLREHGTTMMDRGDGWASFVGYNRAGPREAELGEADLLALVTNMAEENEAGSGEWLAQNDPETARKAGIAHAARRAREMADEAESRTPEDPQDWARNCGARDALLSLAADLEKTDG